MLSKPFLLCYLDIFANTLGKSAPKKAEKQEERIRNEWGGRFEAQLEAFRDRLTCLDPMSSGLCLDCGHEGSVTRGDSTFHLSAERNEVKIPRF